MPSRCLVPKNQWPLLPIFVIIPGYNYVREPRATEFNRLVDGFREGDAPERVLKGTREEIGLARDRAAGIKGRGWDRMHGTVHPTWATGAQYIQLVSDLSDVIASSGYFRRNFFGVESAARPSWWRDNRPRVRWLSVINYKFCAKKIRPGRRYGKMYSS